MLEAASFASKLLLYAAALGGAGIGVHRAIGVDSKRRLFFSLGVLVAVAALVRLVVVNAQMSGGLAAAFSADQFSWVWAGIGNQTTAFVGGAALLLLSAFFVSRFIAVAAALAIAAGFGLAGHAQGLEAPGPAPLVVSAHALIGAFWFAAAITLRPDGQPHGAIVERTTRFSRAAVFLVPLLFVSGGYLLWRIGGAPREILADDYGRLLLVKLAAASAVLALGAWNKTVVARRLIDSPERGRRLLSASLRADAVFFVVILAVIAAATTFAGPDM